MIKLVCFGITAPGNGKPLNDMENHMSKKNRKVDVIIIIVLVLLVIAAVLAAVIPGTQNPGTQEQRPVSQLTAEEFSDKTIGVCTGTLYESFVKHHYPKATISYFKTLPDMIPALEAGMIDAFLVNLPTAELLGKENPGITRLKDPIGSSEYGMIFPKTEAGDKVRAQVDEYITRIKASGELDEILAFWNSEEAKTTYIDMTGLTGENGTLRMATSGDSVPDTYLVEGKIAGYDPDIAVRFCREYGYNIEVVVTDFGGILPGLVSGIYDFAASGIAFSEERKESVNFSVPDYSSDIYMMVRNTSPHTVGYSDYNGKNIGILTGSSFESATLEAFPDSTYLYFNSYADLNTALITGKIDAYIGDKPTLSTIHDQQPEIGYLSEVISDETYHFIFGRDDPFKEELCGKFNAFLAKLRDDGTLKELEDIWFGDDESRKVIDKSGITGENGELSIVSYSGAAPFTYVKDGELTGLTIDLAVRFCREYGYSCEFEDADVAPLLAGVATGKYDLSASAVSMTEERKQSVLFSDAFYSAGMCLAVREADISDGSASAQPDHTAPLSYFSGRIIGVGTGSMFDTIVQNSIPEARISYFNTFPDMITALEAGKVDAICLDEPVIRYIMATEEHSLECIDERPEKYDYGFAFPKTEDGKNLRDEFNEFLSRLKESGEKEEIEKRWFSADQSLHKLPELKGAAPGKATLRLAVESLTVPFVYLEGSTISGYEIDLAYRFCNEYGYGLEIKDMSFDAIIPSLSSGMCDFGCTCINITEERAESVYFSDPDYHGGAVLAIRKPDANTAADGTNNGFFDSIALSFEKNFIREDRWKLILEGVATTMVITALSIVLGTLLAFGICMFRRTGSRLAAAISDIYVKLLQGTPMVVLLMILYYVVLGKSGLSAVWVAIVGFSLNFGAYASEIMRSGIESIDGGQREAALALGYSENQAFFRFIFPQAAARFVPVYVQEIVSLLKSTSVVGYIAIQDLTKMGDIIRSRTYEAFFPLIATAVIYFILAWIMTMILKAAAGLITPDRKKHGDDSPDNK